MVQADKQVLILFEGCLNNYYSPKGSIYYKEPSMIDSKVINLFKESTEMYCEGNYSACLALLSDCLTLETDRSIFYSNRSIAYFHLKQLESSYQDLELALRANHLNFIAYFNLFSLHFLNGNNTQSFRNLCLCLSSAYTALSRSKPSLEQLDRSIYYSFNNKQSIFLKAMLIYQKSQLQASLQLLRRVQEFEDNQNNREGVVKHINCIEKELGLPKQQYQAKQSSNSWYILQTNIPYPEQQAYEKELARMLEQFNYVYRLINDQGQIQHQITENTNSFMSDEEKSQAQDDKDINRITAYNSTAFSRTIEPEDQRNTMLLSHNKELKLISTIADHQKRDLLLPKPEKYACSDNNIYPLKKIDQKVKFFVQQAQINLIFDDKKESIYAILSYKQNEQIYQHRTSIIQSSHSKLNWQEWTDGLVLTPQSSNLEIKILNKRYTAFKDDLLAEGNIQINKNGSFKIPVFNREQFNGAIFITVEAE